MKKSKRKCHRGHGDKFVKTFASSTTRRLLIDIITYKLLSGNQKGVFIMERMTREEVRQCFIAATGKRPRKQLLDLMQKLTDYSYECYEEGFKDGLSSKSGRIMEAENDCVLQLAYAFR